jgi:hypothetical protein
MAISRQMDGERVRLALTAEARAFLARYNQFASLLPAADTAGAAHRGEDGRFVEALIRGFLRQVLPKSLAVASGFILRPAVKTGANGRERRGSRDAHSTQLDVRVYDAAHYPVFHELEGTVILPPEAVVAIVSVKKNLRDEDISAECHALAEAARLCTTISSSGQPLRRPFLALIGASCFIHKVQVSTEEWIFEKLVHAYSTSPPPDFEELIGYLGTLDFGGLFKTRPRRRGGAVREADYIFFKHKEGEEHLPLQFLLTGILSVLYDPSRNTRRRPGFSAFESGRQSDRRLGRIQVSGYQGGG